MVKELRGLRAGSGLKGIILVETDSISAAPVHVLRFGGSAVRARTGNER